MISYRCLKPKTARSKSPRQAARERLAEDAVATSKSGSPPPALPAAPTKLQQLEALVKAGQASDPFAVPSGSGPVSLTERVRDLYENSIVPVREIARLSGVTERTLYKYVARGGWHRRHVHLDRTTTLKGAGGRFVAREAAGEPHPGGLKALDPAAAQRAGKAAARAHVLSDVAVAEAVAEAELNAAKARRARESDSDVRALSHLTRAIRDLSAAARIEQAQAAKARERAERERLVKAEEERRVEEFRRELARRIEGLRQADAPMSQVSESRLEAGPPPGPRVRGFAD